MDEKQPLTIEFDTSAGTEIALKNITEKGARNILYILQKKYPEGFSMEWESWAGESKEMTDEEYLQHAPFMAKEYFTYKLSPTEKEYVKSRVTYTPDSILIRVIMDGRPMVIPFTKENLTAPDKGIGWETQVVTLSDQDMKQDGKIKQLDYYWDKVRRGLYREGHRKEWEAFTAQLSTCPFQETYFTWDEMKKYIDEDKIIVPTFEMYMAARRAVNFRDQYNDTMLYALLGGMFSGELRKNHDAEGKLKFNWNCMGSGFYLWTPSIPSLDFHPPYQPNQEYHRLAFTNASESRDYRMDKDNLFPVRTLMSEPYEV